jgi:dTDP-4-dehydrorhamnose reductase
MRLLVLGGGGMLGHKLCQVASGTLEVYATFREAPRPVVRKALAGVCFEYPVRVEMADAIERVLDRVQPDVVVNCIGIVKQLSAGKDPVSCLTINALFPHLLARATQGRSIRMVTISTDCVFSGKRGGYRESDLPDAEDLYGRTKALGEVIAHSCLTLRTSIIGRELSGAHGLVEWFLSQKDGAVSGFTRAVFSGLTTTELSKVVVRVLHEYPALEGLYHVAAEPVSKHDLLCQLREAYRMNVAIRTDGTLVCDRSLDGSRFREATGYTTPAWTQMIQEMHCDSTPYEEIRRL